MAILWKVVSSDCVSSDRVSSDCVSSDRVSSSYVSLLARGDCLLKYSVGKITKAHKGTVGIFCFRTKKAALRERVGTILRVEGRGNRNRMKTSYFALTLKKARTERQFRVGPDVVLCDSIYVISEVVK